MAPSPSYSAATTARRIPLATVCAAHFVRGIFRYIATALLLRFPWRWRPRHRIPAFTTARRIPLATVCAAHFVRGIFRHCPARRVFRSDGALAIVFRRSRRRGAVATALPDAFSFKSQWCKHYACGEAGVMVSYTSICDRLRIRSLSRFSHQRVGCLRLSWSKFANMRGEGAVAVLATDKTQLTKTKRTGIRNDRQGIGAQRVRTSRP